MRKKILAILFLMVLSLTGCSLFKEEIDTSTRYITQPHEHRYEYSSNGDNTHTRTCLPMGDVTEVVVDFTERGTEYSYEKVTSYEPCSEEDLVEECSFENKICTLCGAEYIRPEVLVDYELGYKMSEKMNFDFVDGYIEPSSHNRKPSYYRNYFYNYFRVNRNSDSKVWAMDYKEGVPGFIISTEEFDRNYTYYLMHDGYKVLTDYPYEVRELIVNYYTEEEVTNKPEEKWLICMPSNVLWSKATTDTLGTKDSAIKISKSVSKDEVINISLYEYYNAEEEERPEFLEFGSEAFNVFLVPMEKFMSDFTTYQKVVEFMISKALPEVEEEETVEESTEEEIIEVTINAPLDSQEAIRETIKNSLNVDSTFFDNSSGYWNYVIVTTGEESVEWVVYAEKEIDVQQITYKDFSSGSLDEIKYATMHFESFRNDLNLNANFINMITPI